MSSISNRFYVTTLEDGTTLHGNLVSDKSLTQAWNGTGAVPDWSQSANQPTIYLTLLSGATLVQPSSTFSWYYNGTEITFNESTNISTAPLAGVFQKTTKSVTYSGQTKTMPALKIIDNIASSGNVDVDLITFEGSYVVSGAGIEFSCDIQLRITSISAGSNLGVINFVDGVSDITYKGQSVVAYARLYDSTGSKVDTIKTKWYINDVVVQDGTASGATEQTYTDSTSGTSYSHSFTITESQVVDHAIIRCDFYNDGALAYTAYAAVDDMQDAEFMYIQYNGNNGNAASLRKTDQTPTFQIWVGTREDPSVLGGTSTPTYSVIKVKLLDGDGAVIMNTGLATAIPDPDENGYRQLTLSGGKGTITPHYDTVNGVGKKNMTGVVIAYTAI